MAMEQLIGQTLSGYRIVSQVGKGGMATVYKAYQPSLDRYVAVKVMPRFYAEQDPAFLKRFKQEARAIAKLRHPNILMVMDFGEQAGTTYIVMEYVEAGTLKDRLGQPMDLMQMTQFIGQVAGALEYAHDEGIIHRDVKPTNILLPKPDWALLTDFGLAKMVGGSLLTQSGMTMGTPAYMSPEQGRGERIDARSDIYSLGVVLYEMATGVVPYTAETPMAVVVKHIIEPLPLPRSNYPDLPEAVERIILKAMAKDPADRFQRATEIAEALQEVTAGQTTLPAATAPPATLPAAETIAHAAAGVRPATEGSAPGLPVDAPGRPAPAVPQGEQAVTSPAVTLDRPRIEPVEVTGPGMSFGERLRSVKWPIAAAVGALGLIAVLATVGLLSGVIPGAATTGPDETRTFDQYMESGWDLMEAEEYEAAAAEFEAALALEPENMGAYWELIEAYKEAEQFDAVRDTIERAIETAPEEGWVHEAAGWSYNELGDYNEAIAQFEQALGLDPELRGAYEGLANAYEALDQPELAAEALRAGLAAANGEEDPSLYENLGWQYLEQGKLEAAEEAFEKAVALEPRLISAWEGLVDVQWRREDGEAAFSVMQRAIEANPDEPRLHEKVGWWYWEVGDPEAAQAAFEMALEVDPTYGPAYNGLAEVFRARGEEEQAQTLLLEAIEAYPDQAILYETLGRFYNESGNADEAIPYLEEALALDSTNAWVNFQLAVAYRAVGRLDEVPALLNEAGELNPDDPWLLMSIGHTYMDLEDCDQAITYFKRVLEIEPDLEGAREGLSDCGG